MDSEPTVPLTSDPLDLEEAKFNLRAAAAEASLTAFVQRHPLTAVALAMAAGALVGGNSAAKDIITKEAIRKVMGLI